MLRAAEMQAMRRALEGMFVRPVAVRRFFVPKDATVRLAAEIAITGGKAYLPRESSDAWFDLLSSTWMRGALRPGAEMQMEKTLLDAFARELERGGQS